MRYRSRLLTLSIAALAMVPAASASAASLSLSAEMVNSGEWSVTVTGQTEEESYLTVRVRSASTSCAVNSYQDQGAWPSQVVPQVPAGSFSQTLTIRNSSGYPMEPKQIVCGYLEYARSSASGPDAPSAAVASDDAGGMTRFVDAGTVNVLNASDAKSRVIAAWFMQPGDTFYGLSDPRNPMAVAGTGTIELSDATRKRLNLPSRVIAQGTIKETVKRDWWRLDFKASREVIKALRTVRSVSVVFNVDLVEPFTMPISRTTTMLVRTRKTGRVPGAKNLMMGVCETGADYRRRAGCVTP